MKKSMRNILDGENKTKVGLSKLVKTRFFFRHLGFSCPLPKPRCTLYSAGLELRMRCGVPNDDTPNLE